MAKAFGFSRYTNHKYFHFRLGRGAVIVAVRKESSETPEHNQINSDFHIAHVFGGREQSLDGGFASYEPVEENDDYVRVRRRFERRHNSSPSYKSMSASFERLMPKDQVALETVISNKSA